MNSKTEKTKRKKIKICIRIDNEIYSALKGKSQKEKTTQICIFETAIKEYLARTE